MSCPLCGDNTPSRAKAARVGDPAGDRCTCSYPDATSILIDPEEYDASEEQFAASLNSVGSGTLHARGGARQEQHAAQEARDFVLAGAVPVAHGMAAAQVTWNEGDEGSQQVDQGAFWRDEVSSRLENYRSRRRRPARERSLPLDFERAVNREMTTGSLSASVAEDEQCGVPAAEYPEPSTEYEANEGLAPAAEIVPVEMEEQAESNLIEFPRLPLLPVTPPCFEELAEPMIGRPRILDVPEAVESRAPLADISVAPEEDQSAVEFELPLLVAPMSRRVFAGLADASIVLAAAGVFVTIVSRTGVPTPHDKTAFLLALVVPSLFWAIYEYLFLVYAGTTPGMQFARLQLVTFDGERVRRRSRRARALAMALSSLSLGLGLIWALLDEDTLCWHDRITRTYVVARGA